MTTKITLFSPNGKPSSAELQEIESNFKSIMTAVINEDYSVTSESYLGLSTLPAGTKFPVGRQEIGTQNFHRNVEAAVR
jgi:hypothetical protein